jgi:hypothetical protein
MGDDPDVLGRTVSLNPPINALRLAMTGLPGTVRALVAEKFNVVVCSVVPA